MDCSNAIHCSAKEGIRITEILNAIVQRIPAPGDSTKRPSRALIFDSYYDPYRGVVAYFRVIDGTLKKGDRIYFMASGKLASKPGHHTIESCFTSQYEQHLRAVLGLPLGDPSMETPAAIIYV